MFLIILSILIGSFIHTTNLGFNLGYIFIAIFIFRSLKYSLFFEFYTQTFIPIIFSLALVINLLAKIIFEEQFRTASSLIVLLSYVSIFIILNFFSVKKIMSKNKMIFYNVVSVFYNKLFYLFLSIEFLTRLLKMQPGLPWFYVLKDSFFYLDANFLGLYLVLSLLFITILTDFDNRQKHIIIHIIFIILSTSRASIISSFSLLFIIIFSSLISKFFRFPPKVIHLFQINKLLKILTISITTIVFLQYNYLSQLAIDFFVENLTGIDGSLNTKIDLFSNVLESLSSGDIEGLGFGNYYETYSIWAHSLLNMHLIEGGLLNFILLMALLCFSFGDSVIGIMILCIILSQGLSVFSYNIIALGIVISVYVLTDKNQIYIKNKNDTNY